MIFFTFRVRETHQIAQAQQEKNARLREAFGISEYFVDGSSFDSERQAKEELAKSEAHRQKIREEKEKEGDELKNKRYGLVNTPSPDGKRENESEINAESQKTKKSKKEKKKKKSRDSSSSTEKKKKKKSKKHKKEK